VTINNVDESLIKKRAKKEKPQVWTNTNPDVGHKVLMSDATSKTGASWIDRMLMPIEVGDTGNISNIRVRYLNGTMPNLTNPTIRHGCQGIIVSVSIQCASGAGFFHNTQDEHGFTDDGFIKLTGLDSGFKNNEYRILIFYLPDSEEDSVK